MGKGSIDYDFDDVISYIPGAPCTAVNDLASNLNVLGKDLDKMQEQFHSSNMQQVAGKIYTGFSNIIGDKNKGLAKLDIEAANILNICYAEAKADKDIVENGELSSSSDSTPSGGGETPSPSPSAGNSPTTPSDSNEGTSNMEMGEAVPSDFSYKHEQSNDLAAMARNMGFTDEEIKIAVGIARAETGNYTSSAYRNKNNWGGMTNSSGRMSFDSPEAGMQAYLNNLRKNYFDQGLTTVEAMQSKYCPDGSDWAGLVRGCMS